MNWKAKRQKRHCELDHTKKKNGDAPISAAYIEKVLTESFCGKSSVEGNPSKTYLELHFLNGLKDLQSYKLGSTMGDLNFRMKEILV